MKRVAIVTLGCKTNQAESAAILGGLESRSYLSVDFNEPADLYIINTCTVTNRTDYKSRYYIRKALEQKKLRTDVKIVVTGCYSQRSREEVMSLGDVDLVIDNQNYSYTLIAAIPANYQQNLMLSNIRIDYEYTGNLPLIMR